MIAVVGSLAFLLAVVDYAAWLAADDDPFWTTVTGALWLVFVATCVGCIGVAIARYVRTRFR